MINRISPFAQAAASFVPRLQRCSPAVCAGKGKYGTFLSDITEFYLQYHTAFYAMDRIFVHDPTALVACIRKDLFDWKQGALVVAAEGALRGKALMDGALDGLLIAIWHLLAGDCMSIGICLCLEVNAQIGWGQSNQWPSCICLH